MGDIYTLTVTNDSLQSGDFVIFQEAPKENVPDVYTVAWLTKSVNPTTTLEFSWSIDYSFVWTNQTHFSPDSNVTASQVWSADLVTCNSVKLDIVNDAYSFSNMAQKDCAGNLYIEQTQRVQSNQVGVGIGMGGKAIFLCPSQPNTQLVLTPKPVYWLAFGKFKEGEVLNDVESIMNQAFKLEYNEITDLHVIYNIDGTWTKM